MISSKPPPRPPSASRSRSLWLCSGGRCRDHSRNPARFTGGPEPYRQTSRQRLRTGVSHLVSVRVRRYRAKPCTPVRHRGGSGVSCQADQWVKVCARPGLGRDRRTGARRSGKGNRARLYQYALRYGRRQASGRCRVSAGLHWCWRFSQARRRPYSAPIIRRSFHHMRGRLFLLPH